MSILLAEQPVLQQPPSPDSRGSEPVPPAAGADRALLELSIVSDPSGIETIVAEAASAGDRLRRSLIAAAVMLVVLGALALIVTSDDGVTSIRTEGEKTAPSETSTTATSTEPAGQAADGSTLAAATSVDPATSQPPTTTPSPPGAPSPGPSATTPGPASTSPDPAPSLSSEPGRSSTAAPAPSLSSEPGRSSTAAPAPSLSSEAGQSSTTVPSPRSGAERPTSPVPVTSRDVQRPTPGQPTSPVPTSPLPAPPPGGQDAPRQATTSASTVPAPAPPATTASTVPTTIPVTSTSSTPTTASTVPTTIPVTSTSTTPTTAPTGPSGRLLWSDEFDTLDTSTWALEHSTYGDGNNELQCYRPDNVSVANGRLVLRAVTERYTCPNGSTRTVTSGMVRSRGVVFRPGQALEFRVKLTPADEADQGGLWPAVWSSGWAGGGWPRSGELDFLEVMTANDPKRSIFSMHYAKPGGAHGVTNKPVYGSRDFSADWHTVRFEYGTGGRLVWHLDGRQVLAVSAADTLQGYPQPFDAPISEIKINLALGGRPGPLSPRAVGSSGARFEVDYIRLYQL